VLRLPAWAYVKAQRNWAAVAAGNSDQARAIAWYGLQLAIIRTQGSESALARAIGRDLKGKVSPVLYVAGIMFSFLDTRIADAIYVLVALMWLIPDRRIERAIRRL
jgi:hypothetical protein